MFNDFSHGQGCLIEFYDFNLDKEDLKDSKYVGVENWCTVNEILDEYGYELTKTDVEELENLQGKGSEYYESGNSLYESYSHNGGKDLRVRVVEMQWKSIRMLKYKITPNPYDPSTPHHKKVKDNYKAKKGETVIEKPMTEIRRCTVIGHKIVVRWGEKPNQIRHEENFANTSFDFFGAIKGNLNGNTLSVVTL